jgi:hypothetical protein
MHAHHRPLLVFLFSLLVHGLVAQVSFGGRAFGLMDLGTELPEAAMAEMPAVNVEALLAEDAARQAAGTKGPYRFGYNHATDLDLENSGTWHVRKNGDRLWRLSIVCPGAYSINFEFHDYVVPEGGLVFVTNIMGEQLGAFTAGSNPGKATLGVTQLAGDRITIEYYEPAAVAGLGRLRIGQVTHAYRDILNMAKDFGDSEACNINVICPEGDDWRDQIRATALITAGGNGFCTGTLLNNCGEDGTPYFLTADHCLDADVANWVFRFNWESAFCDPSQNAPTDQTVSGCELLVNSAGTDVALLQLSSEPPADYEVFYSGWYNGDVPAEAVTGIHHPSGDIKKISRSFDPVIPGMMSGAECWHVQVWDEGTTEPGSSGSGLWNENGLLVGQLFGGQADCATSENDFYGRLDISWPLLEPYLGSCAEELFGMNGDGPVGPVTNDAAVTSITNVPTILCGDNVIAPTITLKNNGDEVVTSITVQYGVVGEPPAQFVWTGSLLPDQTVNCPLPPIGLPAGEHVFIATSSVPNGQPDQLPENDSWTQPIVVNSPAEELVLRLQADDFGSDITWTLVTDLGTILHSGGPYMNVEGGEMIEVPFCLSNGCYTFTINDLFADGICCTSGEGYYTISSVSGDTLVASDGQYGEQDVQDFCFTNVSVPETIRAGSLEVHPNPTTGNATVRVDDISGSVTLQVVDGLGRPVKELVIPAGTPYVMVDLSGLVNGIYLINATHARGRIVRRVVLQR